MQIGECDTQYKTGLHLNTHMIQKGELLQIEDTHLKPHSTKCGRTSFYAFRTFFI